MQAAQSMLDGSSRVPAEYNIGTVAGKQKEIPVRPWLPSFASKGLIVLRHVT